MRHLIPVLIALDACTPTPPSDTGETAQRPAEPLKVMTFNVLCSFCDLANYDPWDERLACFGDIFERHDPDLISLQELALDTEVDELLALRPGFQAIYYDADRVYPDATILYRADRFQVVERGSFWLSPTPDDPLSTGFADGAQLPRLVVWAHLLDAAGDRDLFFAATHFDNNPPSQELSAPLLLERVAPWAEAMPVVIAGDFNSQPDTPAYATLGTALIDSFEVAAGWSVDGGPTTPPDYDPDTRIDHIFVAGADTTWVVSDWTVDLWTCGDQDRYPSDHFAIQAHMSWE